MSAFPQTVSATSDETSLWSRYVAPPDPSRASRTWHLSPVIDIAAYHFSWVWMLVPLCFTTLDDAGLYAYALMMGVNLAHRHYGLPYAYLDEGVYREYKRQLTWFPLICLILLAATPILLLHEDRGSRASQIVAVIVFFSLLWNFWHTYMQKFGIMRLYLAKEPTTAKKTPSWVDKYFLLCWIPLFFAYLGPTYKSVILDYGEDLEPTLSAIIGFMEKYESLLIVPSAIVAAGGVGLWLWHEWRTQRFRNRARLSAASGTLLISTALFWADPVNAFVAFAFSHAVEYMVFVWGFQRRFYNQPRLRPPLMQRLLHYPRAWYISFTAIFVVAGVLQVLWGDTIFPNARPMSFLGMTGAKWFFYYAVYESLVHFHMDGFLWKMRRPEVSRYV